MKAFPPTLILRHRRENLKKCSLKGLENRPDCLFYSYPLTALLPSLDNYVLLALDGELLSVEDADKGLLLVDGTWKLAAKMLAFLPSLPKRRLPAGIQTAYPRRQTCCLHPERGLASVEALFIAYDLLRRPTEGILDGYYWKKQFLQNYLTATSNTFPHFPARGNSAFPYFATLC